MAKTKQRIPSPSWFKPVVTYRLAYHDSRVMLCDEHAKAPHYPLGPVEQGSRIGTCDVCFVQLEEEACAKAIHNEELPR